MIKAIIFDLDDTLYPELEFVKSGFSVVSKNISSDYSLDYSTCYQQLWSLFTNTAKNVFDRFFIQNNIPVKNEYILKLVKLYREHSPTIHFYEDVISVINALKEQGFYLGIISDGLLISQENKIKALKCDKYFDKIILTDKLGREFWKPHPKAFELMAQFFEIKLDEVMYVGDNPAKDFIISKTHSVHAVRIIRQNSLYIDQNYLYGVKEKDLITDFSGIFKILERENGTKISIKKQ